MHYTWLGCIRSYKEDPNWSRVPCNRWLVHSQFVSLGNPLKVVRHHLLIREMTCFNYRDGFPMVCALVFVVTHWTRPKMSYDLRLSSSHDFIKLLHCIVSQPWENIKLVLKLVVDLTYQWDHNLIIYFL